MDSTVNLQQAPVQLLCQKDNMQWPKEFAKTKLSQAKSVFNLCCVLLIRHKNRPEKRIKIEW